MSIKEPEIYHLRDDSRSPPKSVSILSVQKNSVSQANDDSGNSSSNGANSLSDGNMVLDETTGLFVLQQSNSTMEENVVQDYSNYILDEKTGLFVEYNNEIDRLSERYSSFSLSSNQCSREISSLSSTDSNYMSKKLDENSGQIQRKRRKKGQGKPEKWEANKMKRARLSGKSYYSKQHVKNKIVGLKKREKRRLKPPCDSKKCEKSQSFQCNVIKKAQREEILNSFWKNLDWKERKAMIINLVEKSSVARLTQKSDKSRRNASIKYYLKIDNQNVRVCKKMFLNTFCLGEWTVLNWIDKNNGFGVTQKSALTKKISKIDVKKNEHVKTFLFNLPKMESHYCRQKTEKQYLDLIYTSFKDVYKIFTQYITDNDIPSNETASYLTFLQITHLLNIGLYRPKKDQCDLCFSFKNNNISQEIYDSHIENKNKARKKKDDDKKRAERNEINSYTLDVQAVQLVPLIGAGASYFKQKLAVHQFTIYNLKNSEVYCYVWHEGEGGMESNIFASCISNFLESYVDLKIPTVLFTDGCSAQNRNVNLANLLQLIAIKFKTTIYQKYLTVGHTQTKCDSVHSSIERKKKNKELYVPADFVRIIKEARTNPEPYKVIYIDYTFFKDFSQINFYKSIRPGFKKGDPQVTDLKCLKYDPTGVYYKLDYQNDWILLPQKKVEVNINRKNIITPLYERPISITSRKFQDLQSLKRLLPQDYHNFYDQLKVESSEEE